MVDTDAFMTCSAVANPAVRMIKWVKNGQFLSNKLNHTITAVTPEDSGTYTCIADNGIGEPTKADLKLSVLYGPKVSLLPDKEITLGKSVNVKCNVASNPPPHNLQWLKQGDQYFHQNGDMLRLTSISAEDAGKYTCQATTTLRPSGTTIQKEVTSNATILIYVRRKYIFI
ncbi:B-cell receptor CD22-like [Centruroides sculpturatus]|uniref:B-cell receptor CD22-like n=1 Tax=Centruroides sculpturatus TaxID=218467 RepID=UPI000C6D483F|nr:B-cell receptor CD22-like [Centruroides sculpturatus]